MVSTQTRCKHCVFKDEKATKEPCSICNEIQYSNMKCENHFKDIHIQSFKKESQLGLPEEIEFTALYKTGMKVEDMAPIYFVSKKKIYDWIKKFEITR